eukprot:Em0098g2a
MNGHRSPASTNQGVECSMPAAHLRPKRQSITNAMLGQMLSELDRGYKPSHDRLMLKAAITLGVFGLLQHLSAKDITMRKGSMVVVIKKSKTDQKGESCQMNIGTPLDSTHGQGTEIGPASSDPQYGCSPLNAASDNGHLDVVKTLLEPGANINQANNDGCSPLYVASLKGHLDVVKTLLEAGANINQANKNGWSPLNAASDNGHLDVVKTLLEAGANINQANKDGRTSLDLAVKQGHNETIQLLKTYPNKLHLTHQAQLANERARIAEERVTRIEQELSETKLHYEALLQQADEKAKRADKRANQELLETKQHYDALQQQIRLQVQLSEERAKRAEQELLEIKRQRDAMQQQTRLQVQNADERARRAEERATMAEKEHLETKQQRDAMQQQTRIQVQNAGERARRAEERASTEEKEHLETKQQRDAMQQQMRLQVQRADERARRAEERARTAEKEHLETKQQRDAMQQQMRLQVQRADERARRAEERARTTEREHLETKQQRDAMQQQLQVQQADERAARAEQQIPDYMKSSWRVERDEIEETGEEPLGVGGWGEVRVAKFRGVRVAAKFIHNAIISPHNINLFLREMHMAASVRHPNLLLFIGASLDDKKPVILTELMPTNLRSIIVALPQDHVITIGIDVARGLNYLHLMRPDPIIHRDVSSANVLLEPIGPGNWKAKVSDYGSANFLSKVITMVPGNPFYAAPESFNPKLQSPKMDVYSYGILLLEMATGQFPDHKLQAMQLDTLPLARNGNDDTEVHL